MYLRIDVAQQSMTTRKHSERSAPVAYDEVTKLSAREVEERARVELGKPSAALAASFDFAAHFVLRLDNETKRRCAQDALDGGCVRYTPNE